MGVEPWVYVYLFVMKFITKFPEPIKVTIWTIPHRLVTLACKYGPLTLEPKCFWKHQSKVIGQGSKVTKKYK